MDSRRERQILAICEVVKSSQSHIEKLIELIILDTSQSFSWRRSLGRNPFICIEYGINELNLMNRLKLTQTVQELIHERTPLNINFTPAGDLVIFLHRYL